MEDHITNLHGTTAYWIRRPCLELPREAEVRATEFRHTLCRKSLYEFYLLKNVVTTLTVQTTRFRGKIFIRATKFYHIFLWSCKIIFYVFRLENNEKIMLLW